MRCCGAAYLPKILQQGKNVFFLLHTLRSRITAKISAITSAFGLTPAQNKKAVAKDFLICLRAARAGHQTLHVWLISGVAPRRRGAGFGSTTRNARDMVNPATSLMWVFLKFFMDSSDWDKLRI